MGFAKSAWIESQARGWDAPDTFVCAECFEDEYLKSVVANHASEKVCGYCNNTAAEPIAAPLSAVMEPIAGALFAHFEEPGAAGLPRDSGEWIGEEKITYTADALLSLPLHCEDDLFEDIAQAFHNTAWYPCAKGHWLSLHKHTELDYSWENFVEEVKHGSRFFFGTVDLLEEIGEMAEQLGLVKTVPATTSLFRVRAARPGTPYKTFEEVGPPPPEAATAGRMNPAGISYFYTALDDETAVAEVVQSRSMQIVLASFTTKTDLLALDLASLPVTPSVFDEKQFDEREAILFLEGFVDAITQPVAKDGREHIDYVPSQVVSEFFSQVFRTNAGDKLDAIVYPSAVLPEGRNLVMFPPRDFSYKLTDQIELRSIQHREVRQPLSRQARGVLMRLRLWWAMCRQRAAGMRQGSRL